MPRGEVWNRAAKKAARKVVKKGLSTGCTWVISRPADYWLMKAAWGCKGGSRTAPTNDQSEPDGILKNSTRTGAREPGAIETAPWFRPGRVRYCALGRRFARARPPFSIHAGLASPPKTSVGIVTDVHRVAGKGLPA